jgi:5-methylthioribose kinase
MPADSLDIEQPDALVAYLRATGRVGADERLRIRTLAGGVSNKTVLVERPSGEAWVVKQALPKLRVAVDWFSDPARIHREALGLKYLAELAPPGTITPLVFEDPDQHLLAMVAVPQPHENWKAMLLGGQCDAVHISQFAGIISLIHGRSWERLEELAAVFDDRSFFESLRIEPYYLYTASQVPAAASFLRQLVADTRARRLAVVHGDYSPKNILVHRDRLVLLDHEVIHWGDPAFDLGFAWTHLLSKARHVPARCTFLGEGVLFFWQSYNRRIPKTLWEADLETYAVRHTLGCLLARVAGRSPLEYLDPDERQAQRDRAEELMGDPPPTVAALVESFLRP